MRKPTKKELQVLREIATSLPPTQYEVNQSGRLYGYEIKKKPEIMEAFNGQPLEDKVLYDVKVKVLAPVSHKNRLKKAFESGGRNQVQRYCDEVMQLHNGTNSNLDLYNWI